MKEHPFQAAGLGLAPFRCVGVISKVGPIRYPGPGGTTIEVGAPGQPMGSCKYCGTSIKDCFQIVSADGKRFEVGCDCVRRTYAECDLGVPTDFEREMKKLERAKRQAREADKRAKLSARCRAALAALDFRPQLFTDQPHPNAYFASQGKTLRDYYEWSLHHGSADVCKIVEAKTAI